MVEANQHEGYIWPKGWLLAYSIAWMLIAAGIGFEVYKDFSTPVLISSVGFAVIAALLFARSRFAIPANVVFSLYLICLGIYVWYKIGKPGYLVGAIGCFGSTWIFRAELLKQQ